MGGGFGIFFLMVYLGRAESNAVSVLLLKKVCFKFLFYVKILFI